MVVPIIRNVTIWYGKNHQINKILMKKVRKFNIFTLKLLNFHAILPINEENCIYFIH